MTWVMRLPDGRETTSDDFSLADLGWVEDQTGEPWSTGNPLRTIKTAIAFLKVAYRNNGFDESDVDGLTLGKIKTVFDFRADEPFPGDGEGSDDGPLALSSPESSPGASGGSTGVRPKRARSA